MSNKKSEDKEKKSNKGKSSATDMFKVGENHSYKIRHESHGHQLRVEQPHNN